MNLASFLHVDTALVLSVLTNYFVPLLSALVTKAPTALTGFLTALIASGSAFLAEWAAHPNHYDWKAGAATAVVGWLVACVAHTKTWSGSDLEDFLHAHGPQLGGSGGGHTVVPAVPHVEGS